MRLVVADDSMLIREGLARLLADAGFDAVGKAENPAELLRRVEAHIRQIFRTLGIHEMPDSHRRVVAVLTLLRAS